LLGKGSFFFEILQDVFRKNKKSRIYFPTFLYLISCKKAFLS